MIDLQQDYSFLFNWGERSNSTYHVTYKGNPFPPLKNQGGKKSNQIKNPTHFFSEKSSFRNEPFQSLKKKKERGTKKKKKDAQVQACSVAKKRLLEHTPPGTQWPAAVPEERGE